MGLLGEIIDACFGSNGHAKASNEEIELEDMRAITYRKNKVKYLAAIQRGSAEIPEIGGADVNVTFANAEQAYADEDWDEALELLEDAHRKAEQVAIRKPF